MAEIIKPENMMTPEEAKELGKKTGEQLATPIKEQRSIFEELADQLGEVDPEVGGFEHIAQLLALPEEQFTILSPIFLEEIRKSLNDPNDQIMIAQTMSASGTKLEDIEEEFARFTSEMDTQFAGQLSQQKIDFLKGMFAAVFNAASEAEGVAKRVMQVPIEVAEDAIIPSYAKQGDAAVDLCSLEDYTVNPGETVLVHTGIKLELPKGYAALVQPRSGMSLKSKLRICNTPGLIDSGYRGEICVIVENVEPKLKDVQVMKDASGAVTEIVCEYGKSYTIEKGQKIAQLRLVEVPLMSFYKVEHVNEQTERGTGGFGSTGTK